MILSSRKLSICERDVLKLFSFLLRNGLDLFGFVCLKMSEIRLNFYCEIVFSIFVLIFI